MDITQIAFRANNITILNNQHSKNINHNNSTNSIKPYKGYNMPIVSPKYFANVSFKGHLDWNAIADYTSDMGKRIYSKRHVTNLSKVHEGANGIVEGLGLPKEWTSRIKDVSKFDKDGFITSFGEIFEKERKFADFDRLQSGLSDLFQKHGIIDEKTPFSVKYIGHGFQAWAYRIGIGEDKNSGVVAKLFKRDNNFLQNHGNHTEQNLAEYVKEYAGDKSEFTPFYYGDTKHGLMTVKYLPSSIEAPTQKLDLIDLGIRYGDATRNNIRNGWILDYGGIETATNLVGNKLAQDVHKSIKYANSPEEKVSIFNKIISQNDGSDEFKDKAIGLVHSVKYLPKDIQAEKYQECYDLGSHRVNIALIQNIKNFEHTPELDSLTEKLTTNVDDIKAQETIAKEISHIPSKIAHKFFEDNADTKHSATIKYLARNINQYYKDMPNRVNIYKSLSENADPYASVALINSMHYMGSSRYDEYFEKFFSKKDAMINTTLARSIDLFNEDPKTQQKWIDKLLTCDDAQVKTGLCETVKFINPDLRAPLFEKLLDTKDKVAKEFLAENITSVKNYTKHSEWVPKLLDGADNMVRGSLVNSIQQIPDKNTKENWLNMVLDGADNCVKNMVDKNKS